MKFSSVILCYLIYTDVLHISISGYKTLPIIAFSNGSTIGLFNLWYLSNISCGTETDDFFRSDLIDKFNTSLLLCPEFYYLTFCTATKTPIIALKFYSETSQPLQDVLMADSIYESPSSLPTPHQALVNTTDGFEFKQTDITGRYLYTGILNSPSNRSDVQFIFNKAGYDLENGLPTTTEIVNVQIIAVYADSCTDQTTQIPPDVPFCDTPPNITIDSAVNDVIYGDNVTLRCKVDSQIPIVEAFWDTVLQGRINVDASSLPGQMNYTIASVTFNHSGVYQCWAVNKLHIDQWVFISLNVSGGTPIVTTASISSITTNTSDSVTLHCSVTAVPSTTNVYWRKRVSGVDTTVSTADSRITMATLPTPSLTITNLQQSDSGEYFCVATNILGNGESSGITLTVNNVNSDLCPCSCEYRAKVDYWASHNVTNMTYDEIVVWLQPKIKELEKILTVDKTNISAIVNKRISAKDNRPSARNLGVLGIILLVLVASLIILVDVSSCSRHSKTIQELCGIKK